MVEIYVLAETSATTVVLDSYYNNRSLKAQKKWQEMRMTLNTLILLLMGPRK
jgi:hypothetical protein